jgi:hypothetical protein
VFAHGSLKSADFHTHLDVPRPQCRGERMVLTILQRRSVQAA